MVDHHECDNVAQVDRTGISTGTVQLIYFSVETHDLSSIYDELENSILLYDTEVM